MADADKADGSTGIKETDIIFECPYCQKSMAIDYRAAGLVIPCSDCGRIVEVPIPEGMDISDLDVPQEDQLAYAIQLREVLSGAQTKVLALEEQVEKMKEHDRRHDHEGAEITHGLDVIAREIAIIVKAVEQISDTLKSMTQHRAAQD